jgi:hypothetical protein
MARTAGHIMGISSAAMFAVIVILSGVVSGCGEGEQTTVAIDQVASMENTAEFNSPILTERDVSIKGLEERLKASPDRPDLMFELMSARAKAGDLEGALQMLEPIDENGDLLWRSQGHMFAGKLLYDELTPGVRGEMDKALAEKSVKQFEIAIQLDASPSNIAAYWYLGDLLYRTGDTQGAIDNLSIYLIVQPYSYDVRLKLAEIYLARGDKERAGILLAEMKSDPNADRRARAEKLLKKTRPLSGGLKNAALVLLALIVFAALLITALKIRRNLLLARRRT